MSAAGPGRRPMSEALRHGGPVGPADDVFALAATFFLVITDLDPFLFDG